MATMIPEVSGDTVFDSAAEKNVYFKLKSELPDEWLVLHSIWIRKARRKKHAEIDFVIITDKACLIVEVKGGECWKDENNMWHFKKIRGDEESVRREGPFDQARTAMYAVENHIKRINKEYLFYTHNWGYAVITPECPLEVSTKDIGTDPRLLLDERRYPDHLLDFIADVTAYWYEENRRMKRDLRRDPDEISAKIMSQRRSDLADIFRQEIRMIQSNAIDMRRALDASKALTDQQANVLDMAREIDRILLKGGAGSGKTLLAIEQAKRSAWSGKKVLFTCFNRLLAADLRHRIQSEDARFEGELIISSFHSLVTDLIRRAGMSESIPRDWTSFNQVAFDLVTEALDKIPEFKPFDYIVVDEGQDLMTRNFLDVLSLLQTGDLSQSQWLFCYDPQQTIYLTNFESEAVDLISKLSTSLVLSKNCRNTRRIAAHVSCLSRTAPADVLGVEGPDVDIQYYEDFDDYLVLLRKTVNQSLAEMLEAGFKASDLLILVPEREVMETLTLRSEGFHRALQEFKVDPDPDRVCWSTLHAFKGLEAPEVILTGFDTIGSALARAHVYVGGSRARGRLHLLLAEKDSSEVSEVVPMIIELLRKH